MKIVQKMCIFSFALKEFLTKMLKTLFSVIIVFNFI